MPGRFTGEYPVIHEQSGEGQSYVTFDLYAHDLDPATNTYTIDILNIGFESRDYDLPSGSSNANGWPYSVLFMLSNKSEGHMTNSDSELEDSLTYSADQICSYGSGADNYNSFIYQPNPVDSDDRVMSNMTNDYRFVSGGSIGSFAYLGSANTGHFIELFRNIADGVEGPENPYVYNSTTQKYSRGSSISDRYFRIDATKLDGSTMQEQIGNLYVWINIYRRWGSPSGQKNLWYGWKEYGQFRTWISNYTVTYDANGGTNPPPPVDVSAGSSTPQPSNPTAPTYSVSWNTHGGSAVTTPVNRARSFLGWYTAASGGTKVTFPYTPAASVTLYAHWGNATVGTLPTTSKTGHTLNGWYTAATGGSKISSSTAVTGNVTYHAQWTPNTYTIQYVLNGGVFEHGTDTEYEQGAYKYHRNPTSYPYMGTPDTGYNKYFRVEKPTKSGYTFNGWTVTGLDNSTHYIWYNDTSNTSTATSWSNTSTEGNSSLFYNLRATSGTVKFTANWTANTYKVKYYLDGVEQTSLEQTCNYDTSYTYKSLPSKTGHSVDGWWANSSGTGTKYTAGSSFSNLSTTSGGVINRYAKSTPNTYTVSYNANGGTGAPSSQTKTYGVSLTLSSTKPTKSFQLTYDPRSGTLPTGTTSPVTKSCTFNNWKATDGTTYAAGGTYTKNEGTTLTAQWTNPTLGTLPTPTRSGYRFGGWYTAATGGTQVTASTTMSGNMIIYAHWIQQVTLTYNTNGGSGSVASETKDTGSEFTIKNYTGTKSEDVTYYANGGSFSGSSSTTKSGNMMFNGWADSSSATTAQYIYDDPTKGKITLTANKTIYGVWSHGSVSSHPTITAKQVTLTYDPNGGTIPTVANRTKKVNLTHKGWATTQAKANAGTVDYGTSAAIPTGSTVYAVWGEGTVGTLPTINIFTSRTGYRLDVDKPWTTSQNGSTAVTSSTKISVDTTIYAKWEYQITINGRGGLIYGTKLDGSDISGVSSLSEWKKHGVNYTTPSTIIYLESEVTEDVPEGEDMADVPSSSRIFIGYATTASGSKAHDPGFSYTNNAPITLYAVYQVKTYTVKFTDGYSDPEVVLKTQVVNHGSDATPPANPTRSGFTFSGWIGSYKNVMIDTTVKACWGFCPIWVKTPTGWRKYDPKED